MINFPLTTEAAMDSVDGEYAQCPKHGWQEIVSAQSYRGYAGGACYAMQLACGCWDVDESNDVAAAV